MSVVLGVEKTLFVALVERVVLYHSIIKRAPSFKLSLLLRNYLQDTQTLQLNPI